MMMKRINITLMCLTALSIVLSCHKGDAESAVHTLALPDHAAPLVLASPHAEGGQTKGAGELSLVSLRGRGFGLFAWWAPQGSYFDGMAVGKEWLFNSPVTYSSTDEGWDKWTCTPEAYWPIGCSLSFFAYAPYMDNDGPMLVFPSDRTSGMPSGVFTQATAVDEQEDFCLSAPALDRRKAQGDVPVVFNHALTKVLFYFNAGGGIYEGEEHQFRVKSIELEGLVGANTFYYGGTNGFRWATLPRSDLSTRTSGYALSTADGTLSDVPLVWEKDVLAEEGLNRFTCVNGEEGGILYLLPQPVTSMAYATVTFAAYKFDEGSGEWVEDLDIPYEPVRVALPETTVWEAGRTVCYSASVDVTYYIDLTFDVTLADWEGNVITDIDFDKS